ncbi:DUF5000 domain-containing lipoprotein [Bacteroides sp. 224]|uniref:DUF5000 domain-containing lipoprotein n=1 Tax=Bacteroides sp. 224 TaxID=2302936 RepID=UPI0013D75EDE|nr:DUF5000 domain-containing lipoprotein [Bacteroides sp. 224]NDV65281.1 DUF5126 domain-containing protein [Bacteroides sp. 224]
MKKIVYTIITSLLFLASGCGDDIETRKPFGGDDGRVPGKVTVDSYEEIPGGVKIKFIAPNDEDLMYVKVHYKLDNGKDMEARASLYSDEILVEGFGNTESKNLRISAVDRHENEGESTSFDVIPGTPACITAYEELKTGPTFGGIFINTTNDHTNYLMLDISTKDEDDKWYTVHTEYTSMKGIEFRVRGFAAEPRDFKISIRDLWGNSSETYSTNITPLYEEKLDLTKFKALVLPGDLKVDVYGPMENLFNGNNRWDEMNLAHSQDFNPDEFPVWFTFDMGQVATLSRFTYWQRLMNNGDFLYDNGSIKEWEVWGSADVPDQSGSWDGWTKLMDCESIKPSGWPSGSKSEEDIEYARRGEEFEFPMGTPAVRYIRFKINSTHTGAGLVVMQQLWFYGTPIK